MSHINLNGKITTSEAAHIPVDNGAFRYGYGLFETMMVYNGGIRLAAYHWERLFAGLRTLQLSAPALLGPATLEQEILRTVHKNGLDNLCRVRLQFFAAGGGLYGLESSTPGYLIECFPLADDAVRFNENGLTIGIATGLAKSADSLSNLKSCNALIYAIAARQAKENRWNDALIFNTDNRPIETTLANIFWITGGRIYTPPLSDGCVAGTMRSHIMEAVGRIEEASATAETLLAADELFITNAIKQVKWVARLGDKTYLCRQTRALAHSAGLALY